MLVTKRVLIVRSSRHMLMLWPLILWSSHYMLVIQSCLRLDHFGCVIYKTVSFCLLQELKKESLSDLQRSRHHKRGTWGWRLDKFDFQSFRCCLLLWIEGHDYLSYTNIDRNSSDKNLPHQVDLRSFLTPKVPSPNGLLGFFKVRVFCLTLSPF